MNSVKCGACGFVSWADLEKCKKCGAELLEDSANGSSQTAYQTSQGYANNEPGNGVGYRKDSKKGLAIASLVVGIFNLFTVGLLGVGAILGITLAVIALGKIKRNPMIYGGKELATAGLITSILSVVIVVPVGIIAAIAIPNLLAARRAANEATAIFMLRKISSAEEAYYSLHEEYGTLDQLAEENLIDPELATGSRHGYKFKISVPTVGNDELMAYEAVGVPIAYPNTGRRSFHVDETGVIHAVDNQGAEATRFDSPLDFDSEYSTGGPASNSRRSVSRRNAPAPAY